MRPVEIIPGVRGEGIKKNDKRVNSPIIYILQYMINVNVALYPQYGNKNNKIVFLKVLSIMILFR
jgi:hypothetical protein